MLFEEESFALIERQFDDSGTIVGTFIVSFLITLIGTIYSTTFLSFGFQSFLRIGKIVKCLHTALQYY